ncbi:glutamyl-tRNA reductase [Candidatus Sumerlaeota bacterium]|nr:glutamyl-tRNA reductase [Candidatus Sumerlaeota bacterium]
MSLVCLGMNHHSAPLAMLETVSFNGGEMKEALGGLRKKSAAKELVGLSTCNRTEFYFVSSDVRAAQEGLLERVCALRPAASWDALRAHTYVHKNERAARHLFRVAAGVDSLMIGEAQILGQLRRSYEMAVEEGCVGGLLNTLMIQAISFGRRVRVETDIGKGNVSVASIALKIVSDHARSLERKSLLILGAGEAAQLAARQFVKDGIGKLVVLNRTVAHARALGEELGGEVLGVDSLHEALREADFVVCTTAAPDYLVRVDAVRRAQQSRGGRPLVMIDLSMPRNLEPGCGEVEGVRLYALENLEEIANENKRQRRTEIAVVERMAVNETNSFMRWVQSVDTKRLIAVIRRRAQEQRVKQLDRHGRKIEGAEKERIAKFSDSLLRSVLHDVTKNIKSLNLDSETSLKEFEIICRLFNVTRADLEQEAR